MEEKSKNNKNRMMEKKGKSGSATQGEKTKENIKSKRIVIEEEGENYVIERKRRRRKITGVGK
jgi:hypothetical protein